MGTPITAANSINSLVKQANSAGVSSHVLSAIQKASYKTGVDFSYLMNKASQESSFDPSAKATTSSATGLFQFTSQTWLHMIKTYGDQYGLGSYASQISTDSGGRLYVADTAARQAILALRKDAQISANMAGELDKENAAVLQQKVGGKIGATELYLAHFLGASGASNFIQKMRANPNASAAAMLPAAAAANQSVFYSKSGEPRSLQEIYQRFAQKFDGDAVQIAGVQTVSAPGKSFDVATAYRALNSLPKATAATIEIEQGGGGASASALHARVSAEREVAASGSGTGSTLFNTMILSQIQDMNLAAPPSLSAMDIRDREKKRDA